MGDERPVPMVRNVFDEQSPRKIKSRNNIFGDFLVNKGLYDEIEITKITRYQVSLFCF